MTEREAAINRDLRVLDDAHRLGRVSRAEYRNRRRRVLQSLNDGGAVTARKALVSPTAASTSRGQHSVVAGADDSSAADGHALASLLSLRPAMTWKSMLVLLVGFTLLVGVIWWLFLRH